MKNKKRFFIVLAVILVIFSVIFACFLKSGKTIGKNDNPGSFVKEFIQCMEYGEYGEINDTMILWFPSFDPMRRGNYSVGMSLEEAEKKGLTKIPSDPEKIRKLNLQILKDQADLIKREFGKDAFRNATFKEMGTFDFVRNDIWVNTKTGKRITWKEAEKINAAFYYKVLEKYGFSRSEVDKLTKYAKNNSLSQSMKKRMVEMNRIINNYAKESPAQIESVKTKGYIYRLYFKKPESIYNYHHFVLYVVYDNGKWITENGIEAQPPEEINHGD